MKPRTAGVLGMMAGLIVSIAAGALIAYPPLSLVGAIVLVGGSILFAVAATWIVRNSWNPTVWPNLPISQEKARRRQHRALMLQCVMAPLLIGGGLWLVINNIFSFLGWFYAVLGTLNLVVTILTLRAIAKKTEVH